MQSVSMFRRIAARLLASLSLLRPLLRPSELRAVIRRSEFGLILIAGVVGVLAGLAVAAMSFISHALHVLIF